MVPASRQWQRLEIQRARFGFAQNSGVAVIQPVELLEPYFFDWSGDLYGQEIEVSLHHHLRDEAKFDTLEALTAQIERDCAAARELLAR